MKFVREVNEVWDESKGKWIIERSRKEGGPLSSYEDVLIEDNCSFDRVDSSIVE